MTICAVAMCRLSGRRNAIVCISDRMLTWRDEYQAQTRHKTKAFGLSPANALAFYSGTSWHHFSVVTKTHRKAIDENITEVEEIAGWYSKHLKDFERQENEVADAGVIVAGFDSGGPHIYRVKRNKRVRSFDDAGFCAIGSGSNLFTSHLDRAGFDRGWDIGSVLWLMYEAKRASESDPYVGQVTDIFMLHNKANGRLPRAGKALEIYFKELERKKKDIAKRIGRDCRFFLPRE